MLAVQLLLLVGISLLVFALSNQQRAAHAQSFTVDSTLDEPDYYLGDQSCMSLSKQCTLRAAVQEANLLPGPDTITVPAGTYVFAVPGANESAAATGDLDISDDLTIVGAGPGTTVIDAGALDRAFDVVDAGATVTISGMTLRNGRSDPNDGGAVHNEGILSLDGVSMESNHADDGGAIANSSTLVLQNSAILDNTAADTGGGIVNHGTLTVRGTSIERNNAPFGGGGVNSLGTATISESAVDNNVSNSGYGAGLANYATMTLTNVTVSGNRTQLHGGGVSTDAALVLISATVTDNTSGMDGGGVYVNNGALQSRNTIISGNHGDDCAGPGGYISQGFNLSSSEDCLFQAGGDVQGVDPLLGPLADNGGPTLTHALIDGSPAIDHGQLVGCPPADQRGVARPQNGQCDIGAFEVGAVPAETPAPTGTPPPTDTPPSPTPTRTRTPTPPGLVGDANCDGRINSIDAALVLQQVAGLLGSLACQPAADANQDGRLNSIDAALILQYGAGLLAHLPP